MLSQEPVQSAMPSWLTPRQPLLRRPVRPSASCVTITKCLQFVSSLKIATTKAIQNLPSEKRSGSEVAYSTYRQIISESKR